MVMKIGTRPPQRRRAQIKPIISPQKPRFIATAIEGPAVSKIKNTEKIIDKAIEETNILVDKIDTDLIIEADTIINKLNNIPNLSIPNLTKETILSLLSSGLSGEKIINIYTNDPNADPLNTTSGLVGDTTWGPEAPKCLCRIPCKKKNDSNGFNNRGLHSIHNQELMPKNFFNFTSYTCEPPTGYRENKYGFKTPGSDYDGNPPCNGVPAPGCPVSRWVGNIGDVDNKVNPATWDSIKKKVIPENGGQPACSNVCDEDFNELNICVPVDWNDDKPTECIKTKPNIKKNDGRLDTIKYLPEGCTFDKKEIEQGKTPCSIGYNTWCPNGYKQGTNLHNHNVVPLTNPYHFSHTCIKKRKEEDACHYTWSNWSPCDQECGGGIRTRNINITKNPVYGGEECPPSPEYQECNTFLCPIDCDYTWSNWSPCDQECGGGIRTRNINITKNPVYGGEECPPSPEYQDCNTSPCPIYISDGINNNNIHQLVQMYLNENLVESLTIKNRDDIIKHFGPISDWDVSKVENMNGLFENAINFNSDISKWNVSNVKSMEGMFENAKEFNQNISDWDVNKVENHKYIYE